MVRSEVRGTSLHKTLVELSLYPVCPGKAWSLCECWGGRQYNPCCCIVGELYSTDMGDLLQQPQDR